METINQDQNKIFEKIKNLYEKARNTQELGNLEEAEAFFAKVNELLKKHQLEMSTIDNFTPGKKAKEQVIQSGFRENGIIYGLRPNEGFWERDLIVVLCNHNFCHAIFRSKRALPKGDFKGIYPSATIIGTPSNIEIVKYFFTLAREIILNLSSKDYAQAVEAKRKQYPVFASSREEACILFRSKYGFKPFIDEVMPESYAQNMADKYQNYYIKSLSKINLFAERGVYIRSFLLGAVNGLDSKLWEETRKMKEENVELGNKLTALVKVSSVEVDLFIKQNFKKLGHFSQQQAGSNSGYNNGYDQGKQIKLNKGVTGHVTTTKQLN